MGKVQSVLQVSRLPCGRLALGKQQRYKSSGVWGSCTSTKRRIIYSKPEAQKPSPLPKVLSLEGVDVPEITTRPKPIPITSLPNFDRHGCQFVMFDLETTGLKTNSEICQIATMGTNDGDSVWSTYILPTGGIDPSSSLVTGLVVKYAGNERYLTFCGKCVEALSYEEGMHSFHSHLRQLSTRAKHTILIGYNSKTFDVPFLYRSFHKVGIRADQLDTCGIGFVDAMAVVRDIKKAGKLVPKGKGRESLGEVYKNLFNESFRAHEAIRDVKALHRILFQSPLPVTPELILTHATTAGSAYKAVEFNEHRAKLLRTMYGRLFHDYPGSKLVISRHMANKIAASGLSYGDLQSVYQRYGKKGIASVCCTPCYSQEGKKTHRVTNTKEIIDAIADHFEKKMAY